MSFVSLADASRQLGIDGKTLRRWLSEALLPLQSHPRDGRKKGLSRHCLEQLAARHHRALPAAVPDAAPLALAALPAELLALPEQVAAMQAQLGLLQQQVQALSQWLQACQQPTAKAPAPTRSALPAPAVPAAVRKPVHVLARLEYVGEGCYVLIAPHKGPVPLQPDSPAWFAWLATVSAFRFVGQHGHFTAHYDPAGGTRTAWRAHRKIRNRTHTRRLSRSGELTIAILEQAAAALEAQLH